jgi:hypothetical protein
MTSLGKENKNTDSPLSPQGGATEQIQLKWRNLLKAKYFFTPFPKVEVIT